MGSMSINEFKKNSAAALSDAENGEDLLLTRDGKPVLRFTREGLSTDKPSRRQPKTKAFR